MVSSARSTGVSWSPAPPAPPPAGVPRCCPPAGTSTPWTPAPYRRKRRGGSAGSRPACSSTATGRSTESGRSAWCFARGAPRTCVPAGDDLAQALALMGVKPAWEPSTGRVTGFEVLPLDVLDRPRVDVTLRVSGFFRDAFPAQIALIDAAARASRTPRRARARQPPCRRLRHRRGPPHRRGGGAGGCGAARRLPGLRRQAGRLRSRPAGPDRRARLARRGRSRARVGRVGRLRLRGRGRGGVRPSTPCSSVG